MDADRFLSLETRGIDEWSELAAAVIASLPVMVLYSLLERHLVDAITSGAVKG